MRVDTIRTRGTKRQNRTNQLIGPRGDDILKPDERADIITVPESIDEFLILSGNPWHHVRHVLIVGCGTIGLHLAKTLEARRLYPTILP